MISPEATARGGGIGCGAAVVREFQLDTTLVDPLRGATHSTVRERFAGILSLFSDCSRFCVHADISLPKNSYQAILQAGLQHPSWGWLRAAPHQARAAPRRPATRRADGVDDACTCTCYMNLSVAWLLCDCSWPMMSIECHFLWL